MARVTGIGGFFFRAADRSELAKWYQQHFDIADGTTGLWQQEAGMTAFSPFRDDSDYFAADKRWMLNFRVDDLTGMIAKLEEAGITVETNPEWDGDGSYGNFARVHDPEGNPIELWQPPS